MNLARLAEDRIKELGERASLIFEDREITNMEMIRIARKLGKALRDLGVTTWNHPEVHSQKSDREVVAG